MSAILMDGKALSAKIRGQLKEQTEALYADKGIRAGLAVILVGEDPASQVYVRNKERACAECGFYSEKYTLPAESTEQDLLGLIDELNRSEAIHGILCQLPLPAHINQKRVLESIVPTKDVDAFHPTNVGRIVQGDYDFLPCTPAGVMDLMHEYGIDLNGKHVVVIGRSDIVGKPAAMLTLHENATVTICHSRTKNIPELCRAADVIIAAVGRAGFVTADMVREGAVVIDVGINRNAEGKLCGDVDTAAVAEKASHITPVPGGVGPMTIAMLMKNTLKAAQLEA